MLASAQVFQLVIELSRELAVSTPTGALTALTPAKIWFLLAMPPDAAFAKFDKVLPWIADDLPAGGR